MRSLFFVFVAIAISVLGVMVYSHKPSSSAPLQRAPFAPTITDPILARMLEAAAPYEMLDTPCLLKQRPPFSPSPTLNKIQRDVIWLRKHVRERYADRLLDAELIERNGRADDYTMRIRLTGDAPVPALKLRDSAVNVPVVIEYGAPLSFEELSRRSGEGYQKIAHLLPEMQGMYVDTYLGYGAVVLDVYSPQAKPDPEALRHCHTLRTAFGMPVLIHFVNARIYATPAKTEPSP